MKRRAISHYGVQVQSKRDDAPVSKKQASSQPHTPTFRDSRGADDNGENDWPPVEGSIGMPATLSVASPQLAAASGRDDFRTGLVFEAGLHHFDPHNRLPRERPRRILDIQEAIRMSPNKLWSRCHIMSPISEQAQRNSTYNDDVVSKVKRSAAHFLEDEDFLRVHLPGYMKRYVTYWPVPSSLCQTQARPLDSHCSLPMHQLQSPMHV
jgi:hypothetical protein